MSVRKLPNNKFQARIKSGGRDLTSKVFDRKGDADRWDAEQYRALRLGDWVDPARGKESVGSVADRWMAGRMNSVSSKNLSNERSALKTHLAPAIKNKPIASVRASDLESLYDTMLGRVSRGTVCRFCETLSSMFGWAQRQGLIAKNVVADSRVPRGRAEDEGREIHPFTSDGLRAVYEAMKEAHPEHADVALFLGRTGLRWGELAALRVGDVQEVPQLSLRVSRSAPDGHPIRNQPKGGRARTVPLTDDVAPLVRQRMEGRRPDELLFTTPRGSRLNNRNWCRDSEWTTKYGLGRRVHDLRHTAATVWITMGLDAKTIQTWLGHATMKMTMDKYGHYMGQDSDTAALAKLNAALAGGTSGARVTNLRTAE